MLQNLGMKQIVESSQRLNNYMKSVDEDLKALQQAFNHNLTILVEKIDNLEKKIDRLEDGRRKD